VKIIVDADACPKNALLLCMKIAAEFKIPVWTVASFNHNIISDHHIVVGNGSQEADIKVINLSEAGDVVVTQDWGLASMVLGKPAYCLSPSGREYRPENIEFLMEEREIKAKLRRGGGKTKGPAKRTPEDDRVFSATLLRILTQAQPKNASGCGPAPACQ